MEKAKIRYDWGFILLKMLKQHATGDLFKGLKYQILGDLFHGKDQNKVRLGSYFMENAEITYGWGSNLLKRPKSKF